MFFCLFPNEALFLKEPVQNLYIHLSPPTGIMIEPVEKLVTETNKQTNKSDLATVEFKELETNCIKYTVNQNY